MTQSRWFFVAVVVAILLFAAVAVKLASEFDERYLSEPVAHVAPS